MDKWFFQLYSYWQSYLVTVLYLRKDIAVERYLTICRPLYHRAHSWKAPVYFVPILVFSILYNVPKFFELGRTNAGSITQIHHSYELLNYVAPTEMRNNPIYFHIYFVWCNLIFNGIIPFILLITLNILTLNELCVYGNNEKTRKRIIRKIFNQEFINMEEMK